MIFVNSMSDLFHEKVPDEFIKQVIQVMLRARQHIYQVLTKRPERMRDFLQKNFPNMELHPHIWWGVSVENKKQGLPRIDTLRQTPAALRFLSCEPLLENLGPMNLSFIDWIIVGGESGPNARPIKPEWVRSIRDQAEKCSIPFFFKQWGGGIKSGRFGIGRSLLQGSTSYEFTLKFIANFGRTHSISYYVHTPRHGSDSERNSKRK